jgi:hypothetical protein
MADLLARTVQPTVREELAGKSLGLVLAATIHGAKNSRVYLACGLATPMKHDVTRTAHPANLIRTGGRPAMTIWRSFSAVFR